MNERRSIGAALIDAAASEYGLRYIEQDGRSTDSPYQALLSEACAIAGALQARGLVPDDRVALVIPDVSGFVRAFFGIVAAGLVPVPLCPPGQAGDLATFARQTQHILTAARVSAVVTTEEVAPLIPDSGSTVTVPLSALMAGPALVAPVMRPLDAVALLQFTSGSTAMPKGVVLTNENIAANLEAIIGPAGLDARDGDIAVSWLPLYHDMGLIGMLLSSVYAPADAVLMSPVLFLKRPSAWLEAISTSRGTVVSFAPNFAYELCRRRVKSSQIETLDLSRWRVAGCGAEPIRPDTLLQFAEHFRPAGFKASSFLPSYGLAEHCLAVSFAHGGLTVDLVDGDVLVRESRAVPVVNGSPVGPDRRVRARVPRSRGAHRGRQLRAAARAPSRCGSSSKGRP